MPGLGLSPPGAGVAGFGPFGIGPTLGIPPGLGVEIPGLTPPGVPTPVEPGVVAPGLGGIGVGVDPAGLGAGVPLG